MNQLTRMEGAYTELDQYLELQLTGKPTPHQIEGVIARQILNDQAYFLLCWGQLEAEINATCRRAIKRRINDPDWQVRRAWYLYNPNDKRLSGLSFEDRAALVLDRGAGKSSHWARTMFHYRTRNEIAHGTLRSTRIDVSGFIQDCFVIQTALHRAA